MMLVVTTQCCENYGESNYPRWKNTGVIYHKILNVPENFDYESTVEKANIVHISDMYKEYIIQWGLESDNYLSPFEQAQLDFDGKIIYREPEQNYKELKKNDYDKKTSIN